MTDNESAKRQKKETGLHDGFNESLAGFTEEYLAHSRTTYDLQPPAIDRLRSLLEYNVTGGKYYRAHLVLNTVTALAKASGLDPLAYERQAHVLAWAVEVLQASFLVADDIMDRSLTRRGKPCWYKLPEVELDAVNDTLILQSFMHFLFKLYLGDELRLRVQDLFHQVSYETELGQMLDLTAAPHGTKITDNVHKFTYKTYEQIVHYKTACYTFYLPIASALHILGKPSEKELAAVREISLQLGAKFQIQDDYLDCFGAPEVIGKIGTDIQDCKCSWLVCKALELVNNEQRQIILDNYGQNCPNAVAAIKQLYNTLPLQKLYQDQEKTSYEQLIASIDKASENHPSLPRTIFTVILDKIHGREK